MLRDAPRSLETLSRAHPDGWGVAIRTGDDWIVHKSTACAAMCARFAEVVERAETRVLVAHIRQKTVGETALENTHPFRRGDYVFAHNGTVRVVAELGARTSAARLAEIEGHTDSERLFAFVLTQIDGAESAELGIIRAVRELRALGDVGSASFLLACGGRIYAHRLGRSLYTLADATRVVVASEPLTDDAWAEVPESSLFMIDRERLACRTLV